MSAWWSQEVSSEWKLLNRVQLFVNPWTHSPCSSPGKNTRAGSLYLLQGILPTQGSNPGLLHCRWILDQMSHKGSPRILEWVAYPFSRWSSPPRNWTGVSCIAGGFFYQLSCSQILWNCLVECASVFCLDSSSISISHSPEMPPPAVSKPWASKK